VGDGTTDRHAAVPLFDGQVLWFFRIFLNMNRYVRRRDFLSDDFEGDMTYLNLAFSRE
jgi:hypothetical protein